MPRLEAINVDNATGKTRQLLDGIQARLGMVPNLLRTFANSPAALEAYLGLSGALSQGALPAKLREQIALTVAEANNCDYCLAAHSAAGKALGLSEDEVLDSSEGTSPDSKVDTALRFTRELVDKSGWVSDESIARLRSAGFGDGEIAEIVTNTALNILTNYFNHVAETAIDFPKVDELAKN